MRDYNVAYYSDRLNGPQGYKSGLASDARAFTYVNLPRLLWITDQKVLGGYIGFDALIPLQYADLDVKNAGPATINHSTFGVGDLFAETTWSMHTKQFDFSLGCWRVGPDGGFLRQA